MRAYSAQCPWEHKPWPLCCALASNSVPINQRSRAAATRPSWSLRLTCTWSVRSWSGTTPHGALAAPLTAVSSPACHTNNSSTRSSCSSREQDFLALPSCLGCTQCLERLQPIDESVTSQLKTTVISPLIDLKSYKNTNKSVKMLMSMTGIISGSVLKADKLTIIACLW